MGGGGGRGGGKGGQIPSRHMTSKRRRCDVTASHRRHLPTRFLINQCQIITFLILKSDIIENIRIELRGIVLPAPSNQISCIYYYFTLQLGTFLIFFLFHIEIEGKGRWIIWGGGGGGGGKGYVGPPLKLLGGGGGAGPLFLCL